MVVDEITPRDTNKRRSWRSLIDFLFPLSIFDLLGHEVTGHRRFVRSTRIWLVILVQILSVLITLAFGLDNLLRLNHTGVGVGLLAVSALNSMLILVLFRQRKADNSKLIFACGVIIAAIHVQSVFVNGYLAMAFSPCLIIYFYGSFPVRRAFIANTVFLVSLLSVIHLSAAPPEAAFFARWLTTFFFVSTVMHYLVCSLTRFMKDYVTAQQSRIAFLNSMNHNLRTPLHAIQGALDLLEEKVRQSSGNLVGEIKEGFEQMRWKTRELKDLIEPTLELNNLRANQSALDIKPVNLKQVFNDLLDRHQSACDS